MGFSLSAVLVASVALLSIVSMMGGTAEEMLEPGRLRSSNLNDALNNWELTFTTGGDAPWYQQWDYYQDGWSAARSGDITHYEYSYIQTSVEGPCEVSFWWMVSSEGCCDHLEFFVDGAPVFSIAGETGWQRMTYAISGSGPRELRWEYSKDGSVSSGLDAGFLDNVQVSPIGSQDPIGGGPDAMIFSMIFFGSVVVGLLATAVIATIVVVVKERR